MKKNVTVLLLLLVAILLVIDIVTRVAVQPVQAQTSEPTYKIVEAPGRFGSVTQYESLLNDMASKGWEFHNWLYHGSAQTPDLIFKKRVSS